MPGRTFRQLQDRVFTEIGYRRQEDDTPDAELLFLVRSWVNEAYEDIWTHRHWTWLEDFIELVTTPEITAGTASVTQDSQAVTLSTTLGTDFNRVVGRVFVVGGDIYKILSAASGTSITLERPFQDATDATATYRIIRTDYVLPWRIDSIKRVEDFGRNRSLIPVPTDPSRLATNVRTGQPESYLFRGQTFTPGFTTGTISGTAAATSETGTITGSGTTWSADGRVEVGDTLMPFGTQGGSGSGNTEVNSFPYTIRSIDSDTSLTVEPGLKETLTAATLYQIKPTGSPLVVFHPWPTSREHLRITFEKRLFPLVAGEDIPEMPDEFHDLVSMGAVYRFHLHNGTLQDNQFRKSEFFDKLTQLEWDDPSDEQRQGYVELRDEYENRGFFI